jgi:hypothetical protein
MADTTPGDADALHRYWTHHSLDGREQQERQ